MNTLKTIILAGVGASVVAAPAAAASFGRNDHRGDDRGRVERVQTTKVIQRQRPPGDQGQAGQQA